jgi:hypothetical protein
MPWATTCPARAVRIVARLSVFAEEEKKDNAGANNLEENLKEIWSLNA